MIDRGHLAIEIACRVNHGVERWKLSGPWLGRGDVAGDWCCAPSAQFRRRRVGSRQAKHLMIAPDKIAHHGRADRARPTENQYTHDLPPKWKLAHKASRFSTRASIRSAQKVRGSAARLKFVSIKTGAGFLLNLS
jgi:hypothetical protein